MRAAAIPCPKIQKRMDRTFPRILRHHLFWCPQSLAPGAIFAYAFGGLRVKPNKALCPIRTQGGAEPRPSQSVLD